MKFACQITVAVLFLFSVLVVIRQDIEGRDARAPMGFGGVVATLILFAVMTAVYWKAGAFSLILGE